MSEDLKNEMRQGFKEIRDEFKAVNVRFEKIDKSIDMLAQQVSKNAEGINKLTNLVEKNHESLISMESDVSDIRAVLTEGHSPKIKEHDIKLGDHEKRITGLETSH